jgi:hypothetical protein
MWRGKWLILFIEFLEFVLFAAFHAYWQCQSKIQYAAITIEKPYLLRLQKSYYIYIYILLQSETKIEKKLVRLIVFNRPNVFHHIGLPSVSPHRHMQKFIFLNSFAFTQLSLKFLFSCICYNSPTFWLPGF